MIIGGLAGAVLTKVMAPKVDKPGLPAPPTADPKEADKAARDAQKKQREAAAAAVGRSDTILTAPGGLGAASTETKTILGG